MTSKTTAIPGYPDRIAPRTSASPAGRDIPPQDPVIESLACPADHVDEFQLTRPGRDDKGKFVAGHSLVSPGRPRGALDLVTVAKLKCEEEGTTLNQAIAEVFWAVYKRAIKGDMNAAREILSRCTLDQKLQISNDGRVVLTVSTGVPAPDDDEDGKDLLP